MICVLSVVSHPRNRTGDPVKSLRTMELNGTVCKEGYDPVEAHSNVVAVEEKSAVAGGGTGTYIQDDFAEKLKTDPDMLERGEGIVAIAASLSHIHLGCCMRNILGVNQGCRCPHDITTCECSSCPSLDDQGKKYIIAKLKSYDPDWAKGSHSGLDWEMLSWKNPTLQRFGRRRKHQRWRRRLLQK